MSLERRIRKLSEDIIACQDEAVAIVLVRELQIALHEHIEQLRGKLMISPSHAGPKDIKAA